MSSEAAAGRQTVPQPQAHTHTRLQVDTGLQPAVSDRRRAYLRLLEWAFTLFSSVRVLAYLPTTWAIHSSGDSSQHSLWTWCTWLGANATMAAWLHAHNGGHLNKAVLVNMGNATMCALTVLVILVYRF